MSEKNEKKIAKFNFGQDEPAKFQALGEELAAETPPSGLSEYGESIALGRDVLADIFGSRKYRRYEELSDRRRRVAGNFFALAAVASAVVYLLWYTTVVNWQAWYMSIPFFFTEAGGLIAFALFSFIARNPRYHAPTGQHWNEKPPVDIFIATCGEPLDILAPTIKAATNIEYEHKLVYVLDDAGNPDIKQLAETLGCRYLSRAVNTDAKAGNLNNALKLTAGALILALDADQIPDPDILNNTVGYFKFSDIAFVQTAQRFAMPEDDPFGSSDDLFYQVMQPSKDHDNAAFSCGSGVIYRRSALQTINGFSTWNLVEDLHTSMRLHAIGWKSIYHNHPLSTGLAPRDITHVYKQRSQWAVDSLRLFFWDNPFKYAGLTLRQKLQYFGVGFAYVQSAIFMPFYFILPSWSLLTGSFPTTAPLTTYMLYRGVYLLFALLATSYMQHPPSSSKSYRIWAGLFPIHFKAMLKALAHRRSKPVYKVNHKKGCPSNLPAIFRALSWQVAIIALTIFSITYRSRGVSNEMLDLFILNFAWGLFILWSLSWICYAALKAIKWPHSE